MFRVKRKMEKWNLKIISKMIQSKQSNNYRGKKMSKHGEQGILSCVN